MELNSVPIPFYEKLISDDVIQKNAKIAKGAFAEVWSISFKENPSNQNINVIQSKVSNAYSMKKFTREVNMKYFLREFGFQNSLLHPFIIDLVACSLYHTKNDQVKFSPRIIMPCADLGTLDTIAVETKFKDWGKTDIYKLIYSICRSVWFLHKLHVCHRDIKPNNILIMKDKTAKISDFGLTKIKNENEKENSIPFGFSPFYAPESPYCQSYPADAIQLSICLYEIFEKKSIIDYYLSKRIPKIYALDQNRPSFTDKTPTIWQELISTMWYTNPLKRVKMDYVIDEIEKEEYFIEGSNVEEIKQFIKTTKQKEDEIYRTKINEDVKYLIKTEDKEKNTKTQYYIFNFLTAVDSAIDKFKFDVDQINYTKPNVEKNAKKGGKTKPKNEKINKQNQINRSYNKMIRSFYSFMNFNDTDALLSIASYCIFQLNDYTSAYTFLREHKKSENKDVQNLIQLMFLESEKSSFIKAMLFESEGKYEEAINLYSEYIEEGQINLNALGRLGRILFILGEEENTREEGFQLMENAALLGDKFSMFHLGVYYYQTGLNSTPKNKEDIQKSIKYFEQIKDFPDVEMMLYLCYSILEDMEKEAKYKKYVNQIYYNYD